MQHITYVYFPAATKAQTCCFTVMLVKTFQLQSNSIWQHDSDPPTAAHHVPITTKSLLLPRIQHRHKEGFTNLVSSV